VSIQLAGCHKWKTALQSVQRLASMHKPDQPKAVTLKQVREAMRLEPNPTIKAAIEVAWLAAARGGDIRQILASDFNFPEPTKAQPQQTMSLTFRRGKTTKRGQYTVGLPLLSQPTLNYILQRKEEGSWAFPGLTGETPPSTSSTPPPSPSFSPSTCLHSGKCC
jgi:hypothetical protein